MVQSRMSEAVVDGAVAMLVDDLAGPEIDARDKAQGGD